jgi:hypothetical protein
MPASFPPDARQSRTPPAPDHGKDRAVDIAGQCLSQLRRHILGSAEFEVGDDMHHTGLSALVMAALSVPPSSSTVNDR